MDSGLRPMAGPGKTWSRYAARYCCRLRFARGFEQGRVHGFACRFGGPDDVLEGREIALARIERAAEYRLALPIRGGDAAGQHQRVTEHHHAVDLPDVEVTDPQ